NPFGLLVHFTDPTSDNTMVEARSSSQRRKSITLLFSLAIACCLFASSSPNNICSAAPVQTRQNYRQQQRSIAQQVHHVQFADESVHNTMKLIKISIQKRQHQILQQQKRLERATAEEAAEDTSPKVKHQQRRKRGDVDAEPQHLPSILTTTTSAELVDTIGGHDAKTVAQAINQRDSVVAAPSLSTQSTTMTSVKTRGKKGSAFKSPGRLFSAYETIVFSESQMPVFLSQHHHRHLNEITMASRKREGLSSSRNVQSKRKLLVAQDPAAIPRSAGGSIQQPPEMRDVIVTVSPDKLSEDINMHPPRAHANDASGPLMHTSMTVNSGSSNNNNGTEEQEEEGAVVAVDGAGEKNNNSNDDDDNTNNIRVTQAEIPAAQVAPAGGDINSPVPPAEHSDPSINVGAPSAYLQNKKSSASMYHACATSPLLLMGVLSLVLVASYRVYVHRQRRQASVLPSMASPSLAFLTVNEKIKESGRTTATRHLYVGCNHA
ncbi:hypothetical protein BGZ99_001520, partial [Dissophora globulifera]